MRKISEPYFVYFESNWKHCESMWLQFHRNNIVTFGTHTNNFIESFNRVIKRYIKCYFHISETIEKLLIIVEKYENVRNSYYLK